MSGVIEEELVWMRDAHISSPFRDNGLVVKEKYGTHSSIIRFGAEEAMRIGLKAISKHIEEVNNGINTRRVN